MRRRVSVRPAADTYCITEEPPIFTPLNYANPHTESPLSKRLLKIAAGIGLLPLVSGVLCLLGWIVIGSAVFVATGMLIIAAGLLCTAVAGGFLIAHYIRTVARRKREQRRRWLPTRPQVLVTSLLILNFPTAYGCAAIAFYVDQFYTFSVVNKSPLKIDEAVFSRGQDQTLIFRSLAPGETAHTHVKSGWSDAHYRIIQNGQSREGDTVKYNGNGHYPHDGHDLIVTIEKGKWVMISSPMKDSREHIDMGH